MFRFFFFFFFSPPLFRLNPCIEHTDHHSSFRWEREWMASLPLFSSLRHSIRKVWGKEK